MDKISKSNAEKLDTSPTVLKVSPKRDASNN